jgi:hypothetical protein
MDESVNAAKNDGAKKVGVHLMHGLEDAAEVAGHGVAGAVKGSSYWSLLETIPLRLAQEKSQTSRLCTNLHNFSGFCVL